MQAHQLKNIFQKNSLVLTGNMQGNSALLQMKSNKDIKGCALNTNALERHVSMDILWTPYGVKSEVSFIMDKKNHKIWGVTMAWPETGRGGKGRPFR